MLCYNRRVHASAGNRFALLALFAGGIAIGFAPVLVRLTQVGPSATGFFRVLFALPVLWILLLLELRRPQASPQPRTLGGFLLLGATGLLFVGDLAIWHWSLRLTTVTNSTLLTNLAPLFVIVGAWFLYRERITSRVLIGVALALAGATLLMTTSADLGLDHVWGDLLAAVSAVFYASYVLLLKQVRRFFSPLTVMAWSSLVSCGSFLVVALLMGDQLTPLDAGGWGALVALGLITHVGGQTLIAYALGRLPASLSSATLFLQPVVAAILAWAILSEPLTWLQTFGGLTALCGITVATRRMGDKR